MGKNIKDTFLWTRKADDLETWFPCEKKLAFLQLLRSSEAAEKLRKSFVKAGGIGTCGKAGFYAGLQKSRLLRSFYATLRKSYGKATEKPAFLQLLRSFYAELRKNSHDEQKLRKRSNYAGANTASFCEAFACSFYADLRKSCVSTAFTQTCIKAA